jgi:hypothetical protein
LLWLGGGASTIDLWDMKPGSDAGGPFKPIATSGDVQICEHLPRMAKLMHHVAVVRSMSTREADHARGRYYLHTGYVPTPTVTHPSYGAIISHETAEQAKGLDLPAFVAVGGASEGPGFLGMAHAPFVVGYDGQIRNLRLATAEDRLPNRMRMLETIEQGFVRQRRGLTAAEHAKILQKTSSLLGSSQMAAFRVDEEPQTVRERYGAGSFGSGCLLARRLVEAGVPFVEVDFGGWDNHQNIFPTLQNDKLPQLDQGMSALIEDLHQRGLLRDTVVLCMGEFGRTPRINANVGRDHWARAWSVVLAGGGIKGGAVIGATNDDGTAVTTRPYTAQDLMASVLAALGISLDITYTTPNGRPIKIANDGHPIEGLLG